MNPAWMQSYEIVEPYPMLGRGFGEMPVAMPQGVTANSTGLTMDQISSNPQAASLVTGLKKSSELPGSTNQYGGSIPGTSW
jgi:hypothetical protein